MILYIKKKTQLIADEKQNKVKIIRNKDDYDISKNENEQYIQCI